MAQRFGKGRIFKDVDNIGPGVDFGDYIKSVLPRCRVALVLIGPHWLESKDDSSKRRLDDDHDWVRIEIETALSTPGVLVVPVLVNGARMPRGEEVPDNLKPLLRRNAAIIRRDPDFHDDVERLATALRASINTGILDLSKIGGKASASTVQRSRAGRQTPLLIGGLIAAAVALVAVGVGVSRWLAAQNAQPAEQQTTATTPSTSGSERPTQTPAQSAPSALSPTPTQSTSTTAPEKSDVQAPVRVQQQASLPSQPSARAFSDCADLCPEMVRIPGQTFAAGRFEVTFAQWDACVAAGGCGGYTR